MEYDPDDHWDATSWYGYDDTEKKNVEKLIIGRLKSGTFEAFSYSGEYGKDNIWPSNWEEYAHHDIGRSIDVQLRTSEHRSMYSYVRLSIDRCTLRTSEHRSCTATI